MIKVGDKYKAFTTFILDNNKVVSCKDVLEVVSVDNNNILLQNQTKSTDVTVTHEQLIDTCVKIV